MSNVENDNDKLHRAIEAGAEVMVICMPWASLSEERRKSEKVIKRECVVCRGEVALNPATMKRDAGKLPPTLLCGACAVDLMEADGGIDKQTFAYTTTQRTGEGLTPEARRIVRAVPSNMLSKVAIEAIKRNRAYYDARPSAKVGAN